VQQFEVIKALSSTQDPHWIDYWMLGAWALELATCGHYDVEVQPGSRIDLIKVARLDNDGS
jgi:hypothetical protein